MDPTNKPNAVLAGTMIANLPATVLGDSPHHVTATFPGPATVAVGLRYALVVTRSGGAVRLEANASDPCPDGKFFFANPPTAPFCSLANADLHFETVVTA